MSSYGHYASSAAPSHAFYSSPKFFIRVIDSSIGPIIRTVNYAFSSDPLIQWLRPNAAPWAQQDKDVWRWQQRRIQSIMLHGMVLQSAKVNEMIALELPRQQRKKASPVYEREAQVPATDSTPEAELGLNDTGAVVFLLPPKCQLKWSPARLWEAFKIYVLDILSPAHDTGAKELRVGRFLEVNKKWSEILTSRYSKEKLWYLEVIAVHPSLQSRGIGRKAMTWVLEHIKDEPIYLECTRIDNIGFYEGFGFEVVEKVEIEDEGQKLNYWVMVRPSKGNI
ncbi:hypothetical protein N7478_006176 [Penicillium angulare]|uniref:uncharacterized protein n=1 Tax=Penicillium angulare TaxID=116970 RepID=UPI002540E31C|nr:uncharacterized protein N7478_006176 [Penicillium angulare]KAJ5280804.1 hypothetical protein N7478_006176 [Penicillium angulare]